MGIWTQSDIDTLKAAVASGVQTVSYSGPPARTVTYQSLAEMRDLLAEMVADVAGQAGTRQPYRYAASSKGFGPCSS
jgi:hypothetical protein